MRHFLRHFFIPHSSNKYRAKLLHHSIFFLIIVAFLVGSITINLVEKDRSVLGIEYHITAEELLLLTNLKRQERGLPPLIMNSQLTQAAYQKAKDMFSKNYWAHVAPDGTTPWVFIRGSGYEYVYAGENLARGFTTSNDVVEAWMNSQSHRENMLSPHYQEIGFAIVEGTLTGDETVLVVEMLGSRSRAIPDSQITASFDSSPAISTTNQPILSPTPYEKQIVINNISPIPTPTPTPLVSSSPTPTSFIRVAAVQNEPLIDKNNLQKNIALSVLFVISLALILDWIVAGRQNLVRLLSHNMDHLIFVGAILAVVLIISGGIIL
ncbi:MAG: hypothetical protein KatS3mg089_0270 [Patescibacteria group bacterium]|nr:MAG: hypothetical protein KatS3mg089_0270 [Patescibacteria group bacterium]